MAIDINLLKFYSPLNTDTASADYGAGPDSTATMTSGVLNNEFSDITNAQRVSGIVDYRKQFLKNGNADTWEGVTVWIASNTPCEDDVIEICGAGRASMLGQEGYICTATHLTDTCIKLPATVMFNPVAPGEHIFDTDHDTDMASHRKVISVSTDESGNYLVEIESAFGTPTGAEFSLSVTAATMFTYIEAATKGAGVLVGDIPGGEHMGVWKRRTVTASALGYSNNTVTVRWESI